MISAHTSFTEDFRTWAEAQCLQIRLVECLPPDHKCSELPDTETAVGAQMDKLPDKLEVHYSAIMDSYV